MSVGVGPVELMIVLFAPLASITAAIYLAVALSRRRR